MRGLFVLAYYDKETGEFIEYVRKGRNNSITGYDNIDSARRGYTQSKRSHRAQIHDLKIVEAVRTIIVE